MRFYTYFFLSTLSIISIIIYAIQTREQFYPIILYLTTSKVAILIGGNMILATTFLIGRIAKSLFFGSLRDAEVEMLIEKIKYSFFHICLELTILRDDISTPLIMTFGLFLFLKSFYWLGKSRFEYIEQVLPMSTLIYYRFSALMICLLAIDIYITYEAFSYTMSHGKGPVMLVGFEFGLLVISMLNLSIRYVLFLLDSRLTNGLSSKGLYVMILDLISDTLKFITYICFFALVMQIYGLPVHISQELWISFMNFYKKLTSLIKYLRLTKNLDQRFPNASPEEIASAGDCLICREPMDCGKKLPCSHVFHLDCLRMWLQHQQTCPLCRSDIPANDVQNNNSTTTNNNPIINQVDNNINNNNRQEDHTNINLPQPQSLHRNHPTHHVQFSSTTSTNVKLPNFFYTCSESTNVYSRCSIHGTIIRTMKRKTIVFVTEFVTISDNNVETIWCNIGDGFIIKTADSIKLLNIPTQLSFQMSNIEANRISHLLPTPSVIQSVVIKNTNNIDNIHVNNNSNNGIPFSSDIDNDDKTSSDIYSKLFENRKPKMKLLLMLNENIKELKLKQLELEHSIRSQEHLIQSLMELELSSNEAIQPSREVTKLPIDTTVDSIIVSDQTLPSQDQDNDENNIRSLRRRYFQKKLSSDEVVNTNNDVVNANDEVVNNANNS